MGDHWCLGSSLGLVWLIVEMSGSFHLSPISIPQLAGIAVCLVLHDHTYEMTNLWQSFPMTFLKPNKSDLFSTLGTSFHLHNFMINDYSIFVFYWILTVGYLKFSSLQCLSNVLHKTFLLLTMNVKKHFYHSDRH